MDDLTSSGAYRRGYEDGIKAGRSLQIELFAKHFLKDKCDEYVEGYVAGCQTEMEYRYRYDTFAVGERLRPVIATRKD